MRRREFFKAVGVFVPALKAAGLLKPAAAALDWKHLTAVTLVHYRPALVDNITAEESFLKLLKSKFQQAERNMGKSLSEALYREGE